MAIYLNTTIQFISSYCHTLRITSIRNSPQPQAKQLLDFRNDKHEEVEAEVVKQQAPHHH